MSEEKQTKEQINRIIKKRIPESNVMLSKALVVYSILCCLVYIMYLLGFFEVIDYYAHLALLIMPMIFIVTAHSCLINKGRGMAYKYIYVIMLAVYWLLMEFMSGFRSKLLLALLIVVSLLYYNKKFTIFTYIVSVLDLFLSVFCNAFFYKQIGLVDLNVVQFKEEQTLVVKGHLFEGIISLEPPTDRLFLNGLRLPFFTNCIYLSLILLIVLYFIRRNIDLLVLAEELVLKEANERLELSDMRTKAMLSQVKPHFIYNTLSSIARLCTKDPAQAKDLTIRFSKYLRNNLDTLDEEGDAMCSFEKELEHVKNYCSIEKVRFGNMVNIKYDIKETDFEVPVLSIQAIVENAIKHGICKKEDGGTVNIQAYREGDNFCIKITDDGVGFDINQVGNDGRVHVGIASYTSRIEMAGGYVQIESELGFGTEITVLFPVGEEI